MKLDDVTKEFVREHGRYCSIITIRWWQRVYYLSIILFLCLLLAYRWDVSLCLVTLYVAFCYFGAAVFRCAAALISLAGYGEKKISEEEYSAIDDSDLPVYTILIPLYKEANIAGKIVRSMERIEYPRDKLDIKLLLEKDDAATIQAVKNCRLPEYYQMIVVPDFQPKTKPRACNFGLKKALGEYTVIFDAEDRPDADQLRKVVALFKKLPGDVACVQAKLNYYNPKQNLLTKWFTVEYSTTFDLLLPGLETLNIPIPLGGTSNHFRTDVLRKVGGWDPFNVTEDCDLGIRIYAKGYRTCLIDSTTWEEANSRLWNWIRQRSRWIKGFLQTHLTHMRNPRRTLKELGLWGMVTFFLCVGGSSFMLIVNVIYWIIGGFYATLLLHGLASGQTFASMIVGPHIEGYRGIILFGWEIKAWPLVYVGVDQDPFWSTVSMVFFIVGIVLMSANLLFVMTHCVACLKRRNYSLLPAALLMPLYWVLISIGAWKGFLQLFTRPHYWEKTVHGFAQSSDIEKE